jgi:hypothetical protein
MLMPWRSWPFLQEFTYLMLLCYCYLLLLLSCLAWWVEKKKKNWPPLKSQVTGRDGFEEEEGGVWLANECQGAPEACVALEEL